MSRGLRIGFALDANNKTLQTSPGKYGVLNSKAILTNPVGGISLGAHNKVVQLDGAGTAPATITIASSAASGSVFVSVGLSSYGNLNTPTDNKSNTYSQIGVDQDYFGGQYPGFGIRTFKATGSGGSGHTISVAKTGLATGEFSEAFIEVDNATTTAVTQTATAAPGQGLSYSSPSATVTSNAVLLSVWGGDGGTSTPDQSVTASAGWTLIESSFIGNTAYVQFAIAYKAVTAGTYSHTWLPAVNQGAALMMIAVT
jgi:hypothetical protein